MSARLEWLTATETTPDLLRRGDEASDHTEVTGPFANGLRPPPTATTAPSPSASYRPHAPKERSPQALSA